MKCLKQSCDQFPALPSYTVGALVPNMNLLIISDDIDLLQTAWRAKWCGSPEHLVALESI
jgi:hypothetical protein